MRKSLSLTFLLLLAVCTVVGIGILIRKEEVQCGVHTLVLTDQDLLEGWKEKWTIEPPALKQLGARDGYGVFMQKGDETAHHTVYQYSNRTLAQLHILVDNEVFFPSVGWDWSELEGAGSLASCADQHQIRCGSSKDPFLDDRCAAILRYGAYLSEFSSSIQQGAMSIDEFKQAILAIDARFCDCKR